MRPNVSRCSSNWDSSNARPRKHRRSSRCNNRRRQCNRLHNNSKPCVRHRKTSNGRIRCRCRRSNNKSSSNKSRKPSNGQHSSKCSSNSAQRLDSKVRCARRSNPAWLARAHRFTAIACVRRKAPGTLRPDAAGLPCAGAGSVVPAQSTWLLSSRRTLTFLPLMRPALSASNAASPISRATAT